MLKFGVTDHVPDESALRYLQKKWVSLSPD
jgi:hypothetical protein